MVIIRYRTIYGNYTEYSNYTVLYGVLCVIMEEVIRVIFREESFLRQLAKCLQDVKRRESYFICCIQKHIYGRLEYI